MSNRSVALRWLTVGAYGAIGVIVGAQLAPVETLLRSKFFPTFGDYTFCDIPVAAFTMAIIAGMLASYLAPLRWQHLLTCRFPSIWLSIIFASSVLTFHPHFKVDLVELFFQLGAIALLVGSVMTRSWLAHRATLNTQNPVDQTSGRDLSDLDRFEAWITTDAPVGNSFDDRFDHSPIVERMVNRIRSNRDFAVLLQGVYGSGKTSIITMVRHRAKPTPESRTHGPIWCFVSCWDFPNPERILSYILEQMIQSLGERIDTCALRSSPTEYLRLISKSHHTLRWLDIVSESTSGSGTPQVLVNKINTVLETACLTMIVCLDDLDRVGLESSKLSSVWAFLHHLRDASQISIVVSGRFVDQTANDIGKQFDFVETVSGMETKALQNMLECFTQLLLKDSGTSAHTSSFIDPRNNHYNTNLSFLNHSLKITDKAVVNALSHSAGSPRALKLILRQTREDLLLLRGEIDTDELLIANALRILWPIAFEFTQRQLIELSAFGNDLRDQREWSDRFESDWRETSKNLATSGPAVLTLIEFLLCVDAYPVVSDDTDSEQSRPKFVFNRPNVFDRPQSILSKTSTNYWQRISRRALANGESRDQSLLALDRASRRDDVSLDRLSVELASSSDYSQRWTRLVHDKSNTELMRLCRAVREKLNSIQESPRNLESLVDVRNKYDALEQCHDESSFESWLRGEIGEATRSDWSILSFLLRRWVKVITGQDILLSESVQEKIVTDLRQTLQADVLTSITATCVLRRREPWSVLEVVKCVLVDNLSLPSILTVHQDFLRSVTVWLWKNVKGGAHEVAGHFMVMLCGVSEIEDGWSETWINTVLPEAIRLDVMKWIASQPIGNQEYLWDLEKPHLPRRGWRIRGAAIKWIEENKGAQIVHINDNSDKEGETMAPPSP